MASTICLTDERGNSCAAAGFWNTRFARFRETLHRADARAKERRILATLAGNTRLLSDMGVRAADINDELAKNSRG